MRTFLVYDAEVSQTESWGMLDAARTLEKRDYRIPYLKVTMRNFPFSVVFVLTSHQDVPRYISVIKVKNVSFDKWRDDFFNNSGFIKLQYFCIVKKPYPYLALLYIASYIKNM